MIKFKQNPKQNLKTAKKILVFYKKIFYKKMNLKNQKTLRKY